MVSSILWICELCLMHFTISCIKPETTNRIHPGLTFTLFYAFSWTVLILSTTTFSSKLICMAGELSITPSYAFWSTLTWHSLPPASKWPRCKFLFIPHTQRHPSPVWKTSTAIQPLSCKTQNALQKYDRTCKMNISTNNLRLLTNICTEYDAGLWTIYRENGSNTRKL